MTDRLRLFLQAGEKNRQHINGCLSHSSVVVHSNTEGKSKMKHISWFVDDVCPRCLYWFIVCASCLCIATFSAGQEGKTSCSIPPVQPFQDTTLTCSFPENLNVTQKGFSVYHYAKGLESDAIIDCSWINGKLVCIVLPGYEYNMVVGMNLTATISCVNFTQTGVYACQIAGYPTSSFETCKLILEHEGNETCSVLKACSESKFHLICHFSEDISAGRWNFTVYKHTNFDKQGVVDCWWKNEQQSCHIEPGYEYNYEVSSSLTVGLPDVAKEEGGIYSCWHAASRTSHSGTCFFKKEHDASPNQDARNLAIGLSLGIISLVALITGIVYCKVRHGRKKYPTFAGGEEDQELLKKNPNEITKSFQEFLTGELTATYPNIYNEFYFVPPLYFNKTRCKKQSVGGDVVFVLDPSDPRDVRHDRAMQHVMHCLRHVAEQGHEPMFVLTQFQYKDYLNNPGPEYKRHCMPMPDDLKGEDKHVGCFDFLIVHREHGLLVGVVKAVSEEDVEGEDDEHKIYTDVIAQVAEAVEQFRKAQRMITQFLSDQPHVPTVRHTLVLPNLTTSSLRSATASNSTLAQDLRDRFGSDALSDPTERCLCSDDLSNTSNPWNVNSDVVTKICQKWKWLDASESINSDIHYLTILARFFGPATKSSLPVPDCYEHFGLPKTLDHAVSLTGDLYSRTMVTTEDMDLLDKDRVFLAGKPNTGKTRMMTLAGSKRLASGHDVVVVKDSSAETDPFLSQHLKSLKTERNTQSTAEEVHGNVYDEKYEFKSPEATKETIKVIQNKYNKDIFILLDAAHLEGTHITAFCRGLEKQKLSFWANCTGDTCPAIGFGKEFTQIRNCPPVVVREAAKDTTDSDFPPLTDGPPIKHIYHTGHKHSAESPHECLECGGEAGSFIADTLLVKATEVIMATQEDDIETEEGIVEPKIKYRNKVRRLTGPWTPLNFKDILIVFEFNSNDGMPDIREDHSFVRALKEKGIRVQAVNTDEPDVSAGDDSDTAKALHVRHMQTYRAKRKIVIYVEAISGYDDDEDKQRALTSCTSQLILVHAKEQ